MLDKKYDFKEKEAKWLKYWEDKEIYKFKKSEKPVYSVDTPPPTISGKLHIGHVFSYTETEIIARYKHLRGYNVFYPFGFDNNGLPTERLVEKDLGIKAYDTPAEEFRIKCDEVSTKYKEEFKLLFKKLGASMDWSKTYATINPEVVKLSQLSFLDLYKKGYAYQAEKPVIWCPNCRTTIAQAELDNKTLDSTFNTLEFKTEEGEKFEIATTRPELLPAIAAILVNPEDDKHKHLIGKKAVIPIVDKAVPIIADENAKMDKGTGVVMCCTFGDSVDVMWQEKYNLPINIIIDEAGRIIEGKYQGLKVKEAREAILEDLDKLGVLKNRESITHDVAVHERCSKEIEYLVKKEWFINVIDHKEDFIKMGNKIKWYPTYMKKRYEEWVNNLAWDWCISRQRYIGVPFPVWYDEEGNVLLPNEESLPLDPRTDEVPKEVRDKAKGKIIGETDVMDTWATSAISPVINNKNMGNDEFIPMTLRSNASDIIRTWDFYTIVKAFFHYNSIPWENVMVSGFVMASKGEKVSKSKGNSKLEPLNLVDEYGADVIRYWAASGRLGTDISFSDKTLNQGKKLINKLWNVSKFVQMMLNGFEDKPFEDYAYFDTYIINEYNKMLEKYISYFDSYELGLAYLELEKFFWNFCDNYIEIVKHPLYRPEEFKEGRKYSGQKTLYLILLNMLKLFHPYFPFITEEIYQDIYKFKDSIYNEEIDDLNIKLKENEGKILINLISDIRGFKTKNNVSLKSEIASIKLKLNNKLIEDDTYLEDLKAALNIKEFIISGEADKYEIEEINLS